MVSFFPIYILVRSLWLRRKKGQISLSREVVLGLFVVFMFALLCMTFQGDKGSWLTYPKAAERIRNGIGVNFVPFKTIRSYLRHSFDREIVIVNIVGNILLFIPWGFCLPLLWRRYRSVFRFIRAAVLLPIFIEFCQLFIGRSVDIDDVILNFAGAIMGGLFYWGMGKCFSSVKNLAK